MSADLSKLGEPFAPTDIEWRVQSSGSKNGKTWARVLAYVTNRAIMNRLDDVVGPGGWSNEFAAAPCGGVMCGISIKVENLWVTKWDGAENTDIEGVKGGLSGAMKRAAVQWGIGRYLYDLEAGFANIHEGGAHNDKLKDGTWFNWDPPKLPAWALPSGSAVPKPNGNGTPQQKPALPLATAEHLAHLKSILAELAAPDIVKLMKPAQKALAKKAHGIANSPQPTAPDVNSAVVDVAEIRALLFFPHDVIAQQESINDALFPEPAHA